MLWKNVWVTQHQTLTVPKWMFTPNLFFKSSLPLNGWGGIQFCPPNSSDDLCRLCTRVHIILFYFPKGTTLRQWQPTGRGWCNCQGILKMSPKYFRTNKMIRRWKELETICIAPKIKYFYQKINPRNKSVENANFHNFYFYFYFDIVFLCAVVRFILLKLLISLDE